MTYTKKQVEKILELRRDHKMGSDAIARKLKLSRNSVRNYLRQYGLLSYSYPPDLGTGPPSLIDPSTWSINKPKPIQPGGWFYKELEKKNVLLKNASERVQALEQQVNDTNIKLDEKTDEYEKLKQEHATTIQERDEYKRQNSEYKKEAEEKNQLLEDIYQKLQDEVPKINNIFFELRKEIETWKTKYNTSQEEIKTLQKEIQDYGEKETRRQTPEPPQDTLRTDELETPVDEETDSSITIEWPLLAAFGIVCLEILTLLYVATKEPTMPLTPPETAQSNFHYKWYYDQEKELWILHGINGNTLIPDNVITKIQKIKNQKVTNIRDFESPSDYPVNTNTEYITVAYGKNASYAVPLSPGRMIQSGPLRISPCEWYPECTLGSATYSCSGENTGNTNIPNQEDSDNQRVDNSITPITAISDRSCSGVFSYNYSDNNCSGHIQSQQDGVIQPEHTNEVTIVTNISASEYSGVYVSSHLETGGFTPQTTSIQDPSSPQMMPTYFIRPNYPNEFSYSYLMQQLDGMDGISFEDWIKGFLETQYPSVEQTQSSHDFGVDLIAKRQGEKAVFQTKRWKDVVRERAVQEIISGMLFYEANRAIVITSSKFTSDAKKLAEKIGVELWDRERLLEELKKWGYFYLPQ